MTRWDRQVGGQVFYWYNVVWEALGWVVYHRTLGQN